MFERFETRTRHAIVLAQDEASRLKHNYIGTEHELLGLLRVGDPVVQAAVGSKLSVESARKAVEEIVGRGDEAPRGAIPFTPRAKKVLELSLREALARGHRGIAAGHVFLGLLREGEGVGAQVLAGAGIDFADARATVEQALGPASARPAPSPGRGLLRSFRRRPSSEVGVAPTDPDPDEALAMLLGRCTEAAAAAVTRARGDDITPTPWSVLAALAEGDDVAASLLAGLDLSVAPPDEPFTDSVLAVFDRARGLAEAVGGESAEVDTLHLLAVLLSEGEGSVADHLAAAGAEPQELRRRVLALL